MKTSVSSLAIAKSMIDRYREEIKRMRKELKELRKDKARLGFVLMEGAILSITSDGSQIYSKDENGYEVILHSPDKHYATPRDAIDAAMEK